MKIYMILCLKMNVLGTTPLPHTQVSCGRLFAAATGITARALLQLLHVIPLPKPLFKKKTMLGILLLC